MLNPSMLQNAPTATAPSSPPGSSTGNPAAGSGGSGACDTPSFSKVLAGEMHGKESEDASVSSGAVNPGAAPDTRAQNAALSAEPAVAMPEAASAKHSARAGSAAGAARMDKDSMESPEEGDPDLLAGILASLGAAQPAPAAVSVPAEPRSANIGAGGKDNGSGDADSTLARTDKEQTGRTDIFLSSGGNSTGGTGMGGAGDVNVVKTFSTATGESRTAGIQVAQGARDQRTAQARGNQDILPGLEENAGKTDKMERPGRADAGKPGDMQRSDFKFGALNLDVANKPEKQGTTVTDTEFQSLPPSPSAAPQASFMTQPMERAFAMTDAGPGTPISTMQDLQTPLGASGWDDALGQKVLWMVSSQEQVAELSLNPPDLGPLQVTLSISNDQATATFVSQHADVRQALEAALPRLKEMMAESGINLGGATVSSGGDGSQQQGFERQNRSGSHYSPGASLAGHGNDDGMITGSPGRKSRLVDIFA